MKFITTLLIILMSFGSFSQEIDIKGFDKLPDTVQLKASDGILITSGITAGIATYFYITPYYVVNKQLGSNYNNPNPTLGFAYASTGFSAMLLFIGLDFRFNINNIYLVRDMNRKWRHYKKKHKLCKK